MSGSSRSRHLLHQVPGDFGRGSLPETAALAALSLDAIELTVNGRAEIVVQDADAYQKLLEAADRAEGLDGIRRGLEDVRAGGPSARRRDRQ